MNLTNDEICSPVTINQKNSQDCFRTPKVPVRFKKSISQTQSPIQSSSSITDSCDTARQYNIIETNKDIVPLLQSPVSRSEIELNFSPTYLQHLEKTLESDIQTISNNYQFTDSELAVINSPTLTNLDCQTFDVQKDDSPLISVQDNFNLYNVNQSSSEYAEIENVENIPDSVPDVVLPNSYIPEDIPSNISLHAFESVIAKTNQMPAYFYDQGTEYAALDPALPKVQNDNSVLYETCQLENNINQQVTEISEVENFEENQLSMKNAADKEQKKTDIDRKKNDSFVKVVGYFKDFQEKKLNSPLDKKIVKKSLNTKKPTQTINNENDQSNCVHKINYQQYQNENEPSTSKAVIETDDKSNVELSLNSSNFGHFDEDANIFANEQTSINNEMSTDETISPMNNELNNIECTNKNISLFEDSIDEHNSSDDENASLNREFILFQKKLKSHQSNTGKRTTMKSFSTSTPYRKNVPKNKAMQSICSDFDHESNDESKLDGKNLNEKRLSPLTNNTTNLPLETDETVHTNVHTINSKESPNTNKLKRRILRSSRYSNDFYVTPTLKRRTSRNSSEINDPNIVEHQTNTENQDIISEDIVEPITDITSIPSNEKGL